MGSTLGVYGGAPIDALGDEGGDVDAATLRGSTGPHQELLLARVLRFGRYGADVDAIVRCKEGGVIGRGPSPGAFDLITIEAPFAP